MIESISHFSTLRQISKVLPSIFFVEITFCFIILFKFLFSFFFLNSNFFIFFLLFISTCLAFISFFDNFLTTLFFVFSKTLISDLPSFVFKATKSKLTFLFFEQFELLKLNFPQNIVLLQFY